MNNNIGPRYMFAFNQMINAHLQKSSCPEVVKEVDQPTKFQTYINRYKTENNSLFDLSRVAAKAVLNSLKLQDPANEFSAIELYLHSELDQINYSYIRSPNDMSKIENISSFVSVLQEELHYFDTGSCILHFCARNYLPIILIWKISSTVTFEKVFCKWNGTNNLNHLKDDLIYNIFHYGTQRERRKAVKMVLSSLIFFGYELPTNSSSLRDSSQNVLTHLSESFVETSLDDASSINSLDVMDVYKILTKNNTLRDDRLKLFMTDQLKLILTQKSDIKLTSAIQNQFEWSSVSCSRVLTAVFCELISYLGYLEVLEIFDDVVTTSEVNWRTILSLLGCILTFSKEACTKVRLMISEYLVKGCKIMESEYFILGFLFARHASQEGRHVFPSYAQWFSWTFGSEKSSPATTKASFACLMDFLKELVPYEKKDALYAHISQSIYIPSGCRDVFIDYKNLAKARIQELDDDSVSSVSMEDEVAQRIAEFEERGRIPIALNEATIFHKVKFVNYFLPALLVPRVLPDVSDARMKLISVLYLSGKIPIDVHEKYVENCKLIAQGFLTDVKKINGSCEDVLNIIGSVLNVTSCQETSALALFSKISNFIDPCRTNKDEKNFISKVCMRIISVIRDIYYGQDASSVMERRQLILQLLLVTAINKQVQFQIVKYICDFSITELDRDLFITGVIMAEISVLEKDFPLIDDCGKTRNNMDLFIRKLFNCEAIFKSCSILSSWIDWVNINELNTSAALYSLYSCLSARVAFTEKNNLILLVDYENSTNSHFPKYRRDSIPQCCVIFWKQLLNVKPTIEDWCEFELCHRWNGFEWSFRLTFVEFWLKEFFFKNNNHIESFRNFICYMVQYADLSENYSLLVLALQNLLYTLDPNLSIFETWLHLPLSVQSEGKIVNQFVNLAMCLPHHLFFNKMKKSSAFKILIQNFLEQKSDLFLDLRSTSFFWKTISTTAEHYSANHICQFLEPILESIMFNSNSLRYIMEKENRIVDNVPSVKRIMKFCTARQKMEGICLLISIHKDVDYQLQFRDIHYKDALNCI